MHVLYILHEPAYVKGGQTDEVMPKYCYPGKILPKPEDAVIKT